ncbi:MAG: hypothetical protein IPH13_10680 [Planctomycetes bacterium]|nr:hypothetical protein [Planctomycetota bacterium]
MSSPQCGGAGACVATMYARYCAIVVSCSASANGATRTSTPIIDGQPESACFCSSRSVPPPKSTSFGSVPGACATSVASSVTRIASMPGARSNSRTSPDANRTTKRACPAPTATAGPRGPSTDRASGTRVPRSSVIISSVAGRGAPPSSRAMTATTGDSATSAPAA